MMRSSAWDSKYAHNRRRPDQMDGDLVTAVAVPRSPSYPCEHSVAAGAAAAVIAHVYPKEAERVSALAEEAARSRIAAGAAFPSDTKAGLELGRTVAARVIAHMKSEGGKWTGTVPTGAGLWKGTNPVGVDEVQWGRARETRRRVVPIAAEDRDVADSGIRKKFPDGKLHYPPRPGVVEGATGRSTCSRSCTLGSFLLSIAMRPRIRSAVWMEPATGRGQLGREIVEGRLRALSCATSAQRNPSAQAVLPFGQSP
jgi:hypothetical protein